MNINTKQGMQDAVRWTENLFNQIKPGGTWMVPRSGTVLQIFHSAKLVRITAGPVPDPSLARVIEAMGWTVEPAAVYNQTPNREDHETK
jgi:hypothetical protein